MLEQPSNRMSDLPVLIDAIKEGYTNKFTKLLKKFKNDVATLNKPFKIRRVADKEATEMTVLNVAIDIAFEKNDTFFLRKLLESGANPNIPVTIPALIQAACCQPSPALPILLAKPQSLNLTIRDSRGITALHHACQYGFFDNVLVLIKAGADINATMPDGTTPLMCAAEKGHVRIVQLLCDNNVELLASKKDEDLSLIALDFATINNKIAAVKIIVDAIAKRYGKSPSPEITHKIFISWQLAEGNATVLPLVKNILLSYVKEHEIKEANTKEHLYEALYPAVRAGDLIMLQSILDNNPALDINKLHLVEGTQISVGSTLLLAAVLSKHKYIAEFLLNRGADPTVGHGAYPLHTAIAQKDEDMVKLLLECPQMQSKLKEHINLRDVNGKAPIHYAAAIDNYYILDKLLDAGADPNMIAQVNQDKDNFAEIIPLLISVVHKNLPAIAALLQRGAHSVEKDSSHQLLKSAIDTGDLNVVRTLLNRSKIKSIADYLNNTFIKGMPTLYYAICTSSKEMVECLLDLGADIERAFALQDPAFILRSFESQLKEDQKEEKLSFVVRPIHCAIEIEKLEIAKLLQQRGASLNVILPAERNVLLTAFQSNNIEIVQFVLQWDVEPTFRFKIGQKGVNEEIIYLPKNIHIMELLLKHSKFNRSHNITTEGTTPLHIACRKRDFDKTKMLMDAGFDLLSAPTKNSPFVLALSNCHDKSFLKKLFNLLGEKGILEKALNMPLTRECYPLQLIYLFNRKLTRFCIKNGANPNIPCPDDSSLTIAEKLGIRESSQHEKAQNSQAMVEITTEYMSQISLSGRKFLLNNGYSEQEISAMQSAQSTKPAKSSTKFWRQPTKQRANVVATKDRSASVKPQPSLRRS